MTVHIILGHLHFVAARLHYLLADSFLTTVGVLGQRKYLERLRARIVPSCTRY